MAIIKRGKIWYIYYYSPGGKKVWESIGPSKKLAEQMDAKRKVEILEGKFQVKRPKKIKFEELLELYFNDADVKHKLKPKTFERYQTSANQLKPYLEGLSLQSITSSEINRYRQERSRDREPATVNRDMAFLRRIFNFAKKEGLTSSNPLDSVEFLDENNIRTRYLETDEVGKLLEVSESIPHLYLSVMIALHTGMRKGEILSLWLPQKGDDLDKLNWVDLGNRHFHLHITKSKKYRTVPINDALFGLVENSAGKRCGERLFPVKDIRYCFEEALKRAGIKNATFHDLRRTFISHAMMAGYSQEIIQRVVGQEDPAIFKRYAHLAPDMQVRVMEQVGKILIVPVPAPLPAPLPAPSPNLPWRSPLLRNLRKGRGYGAAEARDRTGMRSPSPVFETGASASSATSAWAPIF